MILDVLMTAVLATPSPEVAGTAPCPNPVVRVLHKAGFRGPDLRTAWAIVMRESKGNPRAISRTGDYGLAQINRRTWQHAPWWDTRKMLEPAYNAAAMWRIAEGGKTFRAWGLDGRGRKHPASPYPDATHRAYLNWWKAYPCSS
jgi:hypothetical protein